MARNLDEFANDLTNVTQQIVQAAAQGARTTAQARALYEAAATGGEAAVRAPAPPLAPAALARVMKPLERCPPPLGAGTEADRAGPHPSGPAGGRTPPPGVRRPARPAPNPARPDRKDPQ